MSISPIYLFFWIFDEVNSVLFAPFSIIECTCAHPPLTHAKRSSATDFIFIFFFSFFVTIWEIIARIFHRARTNDYSATEPHLVAKNREAKIHWHAICKQPQQYFVCACYSCAWCLLWLLQLSAISKLNMQGNNNHECIAHRLACAGLGWQYSPWSPHRSKSESNSNTIINNGEKKK